MTPTTNHWGSRPPAALLGSAVLASALALAGCGGSTPAPSTSASESSVATTSSPAAEPTPESPSPTPSVPAGRTLSVSVTGSTVKPAPSTVDLPVGETLTLTVASDHADEVHAHGFEVEKEVEAGGTVTLVLTGKEPGIYEVEMHHPALTLLKIAVR